MYFATRRGAALLAASATLGTAVVTPIATATAAPVEQRGLLDGLTDPVASLLALLGNAGQVQTLLSTFGLTAPAQLAQLLQTANAGQLATLLDGLNTGQLDGALDALTPAQLQTLVARLASGDVAGVVALLSPDQITGLANAGGAAQALSGLQSVLSSLTAGTPAAGPLSDLIAQVTALVGTTPSGDLGKLDPLLSALAPVLGTAGLDSSRVAALGSALTSLVGSGDPTSGAAAVLGALGLLGTVPGTTTPGGTTTTPGGTTTTPGGTTTTPTVTVARGKLGRLKVAGNRKSVRVTLRSAAATSVYVAGTVRSKAAFKGRFIALPGGVTVVKFKLSKAARKGGSLKVTVATAGSTATPVSKRVKIKRVTHK